MAVAATVLSLAVASPARADVGADDQQYLDLLTANGLACGQTAFECPFGDASMIAVGHAICRQLHGGNSVRSLGTQIVRSRPGVQPQQAATLVVAAQTAYCP
jgi:hypothetical protein